MVLSFHKYWNYNNQNSIGHILKAREEYNIPVWLGETGENSNVWFTEAIRLLESNNIGWAWWPLKKMGFNNPLEIRSDSNYDKVLNYWSGKGKKPAADVAYSGLMQLAGNTKLENAIYHPDVIDAMFRQPFSAKATSFKQHIISGSVTLFAVDYDLGRNGVAYFDRDTADYRVSGVPGVGNKGRVYRNDGVDIRRDSTTTGSYFVSDFEKGEWLQYTILVAKKGLYNLALGLFSESANSRFSIRLNDQLIATNLAVQKKGKYQSWQVQRVNRVALEAGQQVIRIYADEGMFNLKTIGFSLVK